MFQVYPENPDQMELITQQAMRAGFTGGVVVDYPNSTKAKKCVVTHLERLQLIPLEAHFTERVECLAPLVLLGGVVV